MNNFFSNFHELLIGLDLDVIITFLVTLLMIFFGLSSDTRGKNFKLKFISIQYLLLFLSLIFFKDHFIIAIVISLISSFAGGISFLSSNLHSGNHLTVEKELPIVWLFLYSILAWLSLIKMHIWILAIFTTYIVSFLLSNETTLSLYQYKEWILIIIILVFFFLHYLKTLVDYFDFYDFKYFYNILEIDSLNQITEDNIDLISFLCFMEDKNLLYRKESHVSLFDIENRKKPTFLNDIKLNDTKENWFKSFKHKYARGYSTLEQQLSRKNVLKPNSYRYFFRRKFFIEFIYTYFFIKALSYRDSRIAYNRRNKRKRIEVRRNYIWKYKLIVLNTYFIKILNRPASKEEICEQMAKNSRVDHSLYNSIYDKFEGSQEQKELIARINNLKNIYF
ncbi:hypothetical protein CSV69_13735 [Sporosarcina sp. P26b]|uniref:hypothetical protein n=1 Tax=Sporosarcina sp. P26b TaxID=2048253 RepID=UPI000C1628FA|nr:hypothetical protein [Sporosarcina sp. P26b]PIC94995.1 hypothetical protein CSV69_13735 [Sporosarcina sp. P26b]